MLDQLEDSPDLSDEEVAMAQAATEKDIPDHLRGITCCAWAPKALPLLARPSTLCSGT
jgi:hypothetical protein